MTADAQLERERIGMRMRSRLWRMRPAPHHRPVGGCVPALAHDEIAAVPKCTRAARGRRHVQILVSLDSRGAKEPHQLFHGLARDVGAIAALQHGCPDRQCVAEIVCRALAKENEAATIIVPDQWRCAVWTSDVYQVVEQR